MDGIVHFRKMKILVLAITTWNYTINVQKSIACTNHGVSTSNSINVACIKRGWRGYTTLKCKTVTNREYIC